MSAFFALAILLVQAVLVSDFNAATSFAAVLSSIGTVFLVALTGWYATETRAMAKEAEQSRKDDRLREQKANVQERINLRRALIQEIGKIRYYGQRAEQYHVGISDQDLVALSEVYEANSDSIGKLTEEEVDVVVEYYARLVQLESMIDLQRVFDSPHYGDSISKYFRYIRLYQGSFFQWITRGWFKPNYKKREERVRELYDDLEDSQERAIETLEENLATEREELEELRGPSADSNKK
ncbi:hypothetical protein [Halobaculum sp. EA56]|uniref:hypothetical protein n=1 Tax=Halobaculum sp. EA56 TaxID=3421648 RepID=UPI003EC0E4D0